MPHNVMCRVCKQRFDAKPKEENEIWLMTTRNQYYHKKCYEEWRKAREHTDEEWHKLIYALIVNDLKGSYNWGMVEAQIKKLVDQRHTYKGIYFTLYWYFIINNHKWDEKYGIGIVAKTYGQATDYWIKQEEKATGICDQIKKLNLEKMERKPIVIPKKKRQKKQIQAPE